MSAVAAPQGVTAGGAGFVLCPVAMKIANLSRVFAAGNNSFARAYRQHLPVRGPGPVPAGASFPG